MFAFPGGAISTLCHQVLNLPGPGTGIAVVVGPWLAFFSLLAGLLTRRARAAFLTAAVFGGSVSLLALLGAVSKSKGAFGSPEFLGGAVLAGAAAALALYAARRLRSLLRAGLPGALAGCTLLGYMWIVIFPRTAGWVKLPHVPLLLGLAVPAGLLAGWAAAAVSSILLPILDDPQK